MDKKTKRCYRKCWLKEKSKPGIILDLVLGMLLIYITASLILREIGFARNATPIPATCITLIFITIYALIYNVRFERYIKRERNRMISDMCMNAALFMSESEFSSVAQKPFDHAPPHDCSVCIFQTTRETDADSIICAYRKAKATGMKSMRIISLSPLTAEAQEILNRISDIRTDVAERNKLIEVIRNELKITEAAADESFIAEYNKNHTHAKFFQRLRRGRQLPPYLICGFILLGLSFVLKYSLYYRFLAALCFWICILLTFLKRREE